MTRAEVRVCTFWPYWRWISLDGWPEANGPSVGTHGHGNRSAWPVFLLGVVVSAVAQCWRGWRCSATPVQDRQRPALSAGPPTMMIGHAASGAAREPRHGYRHGSLGRGAFRGRPAGATPRGSGAAARRGPLHRRRKSRRPGVMVDAAQPYAHGILRGIDAAAARAMPGVLGVYTNDDLAGSGIKPLACGASLTMPTAARCASRPCPRSRIARSRFVGDAIAAVVAETAAIAKQAAEEIVRRYRAAARGDHAAGRRRRAARRCCTTTRRATWPSNSSTAIRRRSRPPSLVRRMSRG